MDWQVLAAPSKKIQLAQAFVRNVPAAGVNRRSLAHAAAETLGNRNRLKEVFDGGPTQALWFISEISDASMRAAFVNKPARDLSEIIDMRLDQNVLLKAFVRRVMGYDVLHPVQALARMQRTAHAMIDCLPSTASRPGAIRLTALNLVYTTIVVLWLLDRSPCDRRTKAATRIAMRWLAL